MKYNYKCIVSNGNKRYYKSVNGKWKRITNKSGAKAEKNKRTYRLSNKEIDELEKERNELKNTDMYGEGSNYWDNQLGTNDGRINIKRRKRQIRDILRREREGGEDREGIIEDREGIIEDRGGGALRAAVGLAAMAPVVEPPREDFDN